MNSIVSPFFADLMLWLMYIMVAAALLVIVKLSTVPFNYIIV